MTEKPLSARTEEDESADEGSEERPSLLRQVIELVVTVAVAVVLAQGVRMWIAEGYRTPTESMVPTIQTVDWTLFEKISYRFGSPEPGDIVTLDDPSGVQRNFMKRVIAVGGQTVDIRDGRVIVDGVALDEPYTHGQLSEPQTLAMPVTVPEDFVWVMGDNRRDSQDSRTFGAVPVSSVHGRALVRYWPFNRLGDPDTP